VAVAQTNKQTRPQSQKNMSWVENNSKIDFFVKVVHVLSTVGRSAIGVQCGPDDGPAPSHIRSLWTYINSVAAAVRSDIIKV